MQMNAASQGKQFVGEGQGAMANVCTEDSMATRRLAQPGVMRLEAQHRTIYPLDYLDVTGCGGRLGASGRSDDPIYVYRSDTEAAVQL